MKKNFKLLTAVLLPLLVMTACQRQGADQVDVENHAANNRLVTAVQFNEESLTLNVGETFLLTPIISYRDNKEVEVDTKWINSNPRVVEVFEGQVTALATGVATVSYRAGYKLASCVVTVSAPQSGEQEEFDPEALSIHLSSNSRSLTVGGTFVLTVTTNRDVELSWNNTHPEVASFENGLVTALSVGTTTITVSAEGAFDSCVVTVTESGGGEGGEIIDDEDLLTCTVYFFIDYNNIDLDDDTGTKLLTSFKWYADRPLSESGKVPADPTKAMDPAFPYFIGWSSHTIIDSKDDLWNMSTDVVGNAFYFYIYGIWSDVSKENFTK